MKIKHKNKIRLSIVGAILAVLMLFFVLRANAIVKPQLMMLAVQKTNDAISLLTQRVLSHLEYDAEDLIVYRYHDNGQIQAIEYDTRAINEVLNHALDTMNDSLVAASEGKEDPILKEVFFNDGILYEVPVGYLTGITLLQNYGYRFKISMRILHYVNGDLEVVSKPYGINNSLLTINLHLNIEAQAITAIGNKKIQFTEKLPIVIQVVQGQVPAYNGFLTR